MVFLLIFFRAVQALNDCQAPLREILRQPLILDIQGISSFNDSVIFAETTQKERLQEIAGRRFCPVNCVINR
jgi:ribosomal silencing factor RsfS